MKKFNLICIFLFAISSLLADPTVKSTAKDTLAGVENIEYFGYMENGDKPTIGIKLVFSHGILTTGSFMILSPEFPKAKSGQVCNFITIVHEENKSLIVSYYLNNSGKLILTTNTFEIKAENEKEIILIYDKVEFKLNKVGA